MKEQRISQRPSNRAALRALMVLALAVIVLAYSAPDIRRVWQPEGVFGFTTDDDLIVNQVKTDSPAARAGLRVGDRVEVPATRSADRVDPYETPSNGQEKTLAVVRGPQRRYVTMASVPESMDIGKRALIIGRELAMLLFLALGAALVLLRPSIVSWAFYVFCLGLNGSPWVILINSVPPPWNIAIYVLVLVIYQAAFVGVAVFAAQFLHEQSVGWRRAVCRLSPYAVLLLCGLEVYNDLGQRWFSWPIHTTSTVLEWLDAFVMLVALYAFVDTYVRSRGSDRQRIRWVIAGFGVALAGRVWVAFAPLALQQHLPYWVYASPLLLAIAIPLTVAYAVMKHRVIDVTFVISRAIVFTILTSFVVVVFSLIDWFFVRKLEQTGLGVIAGFLAVIVLGFSANALHRRVDTLVERTFFRQRHLAEVRLGQLARDLPSISSVPVLDTTLVKEPYDAFRLTSAAVFRRASEDSFVRAVALGWPDDTLLTLPSSAPPFAKLTDLHDTQRIRWGDPAGAEFAPPDHQPVLAMPIIVHKKLQALALYGPHADGADFDPDEIRFIAALMLPAAAAQLEAEHAEHGQERGRPERERLSSKQLFGSISESDEIEINPS